MSEPKPNTLGHLAKNLGEDWPCYAEVMWTPEDIQGLASAPNYAVELSEDECKEFLLARGKYIRDRITELGWEVIDIHLSEWLQETGRLG